MRVYVHACIRKNNFCLETLLTTLTKAEKVSARKKPHAALKQTQCRHLTLPVPDDTEQLISSAHVPHFSQGQEVHHSSKCLCTDLTAISQLDHQTKTQHIAHIS